MTEHGGNQPADTRDIGKPVFKGVVSAINVMVTLAVIIVRFTVTPEAVDPIIQAMNYLAVESPGFWAMMVAFGIIVFLMYLVIGLGIVGLPVWLVLAQLYGALYVSSLMALLSALGLPALPNLIFGAIAAYGAYLAVRAWNVDQA